MSLTPDRWAFQDDTLDNGLRVVTIEDHRSPIVSVQVWYHVGSKNEDPHRQGFAHMFEHMMFRGTDRIGPQDHFRYLNRYGARVNGYTSFDQTVYWETLPASQLNLALWLEAERMGHLKINDAYFAAEREVVKEERRMRYLNRPYGRLYETLFDAAFHVHPYRWTPIGSIPHLNAATADELRAFFQTYYVPNNATLVVVGDVRHGEVMAKVRRYFGDLPRRTDPPRVSTIEPPITQPRRVEITDRAPSPRIVLAYHAPAAPDLDALKMDVLTRILSVGQSSRLYRHLVLGQKIAVEAYAQNYALEQGGLFTFSATLKPEVSIEQAERALMTEIDLLLEKGLEGRELDKARNQAVAEYVRACETVQGRADQLGYAAVVLGDIHRVNTDLDRLRTMTAVEVLAVARRVFTPDNRITIIVRPDPNPPPAAETDNNASHPTEAISELQPPKDMPAGQPPRPVDLPFPALRRLDNGLQVVVFSDHTVPAVTVSYNALIGAKNDPPTAAGLAYVTANTMRRGTLKHTGDELAELIDSHAMSWWATVEHENVLLSLWTLGEHLDLAAELLAEMLREPSFPDDEVSGFVSRAAAREAINEQDPSTIASRALDRTLFGEHYLARPAGGTSASLKGITRKQVVDFHRRFFAPEGASLVFTGDVTVDRAVQLAEQWFGVWQGRSEIELPPPPPAPARQRLLIVDRPGSVQSEIRIGQVVSLTRRDEDYPAVRLLSYLFGESFDSWLNQSLRIERGLTYGSWGRFEADADIAAFKLGTFTQTERTTEAIGVALAVVDRLSNATIEQAALEHARDALIGRFQMSLETPAQTARAWWNLVVWGLPEKWYSEYQKAIIQTRDPKKLTEAAGRLLDPARLSIIVVGDAAQIRGDLARIGPVEQLDNPE